jgi:hypothetical protein
MKSSSHNHVSRAIITAFVVAIVMGCQPSRPRAETGAPPQWDMDLAEAVLRRQIGDSGIERISLRKTVYISVLDQDAPLELLQKLMSPQISAYRGSEFVAGKGVKHTIDRIEYLDPSHAMVDASWYQNSAAAMDYRYQVEKTGGRWKIAQVTLVSKS